MGIISDFYKFRKTFILLLTPLLFLPILIVYQSREISCAYTIILMAIYWVSEVVPLAVTALLPLALYPLLGVVPAKEVSIQYLKDVNVLFLGGLTMAVAVESWNLHKRVALKVLTKVGAKPRWLLLGFMATTAFLSMWISNVATTAMMIPIAQAVLDELCEDQVKLNSDSSTPDSLQAENNRAEPNEKNIVTTFISNESHLAQEIGSIGAAKALKKRQENSSSSDDVRYANGNVRYAAVSQVPRDDDDDGSFFNNNENIPRINIVEPDSPASKMSPKPSSSPNNLDVAVNINDGFESPISSTKQLISDSELKNHDFNLALEREKKKKGLSKSLTISICYAANIGGTATLTGTGPNLIMAGIFKTTYPQAPEIDFGSWVVFAFPGMLIFLAITWLWLQYLFLDLNWREICPCFRKKVHLTEEERRTEAVIKRQYDLLGAMSFAEYSVLFLFLILVFLWLTRDPGFVNGWGSLSIFKDKYVTDATVAIAIAFILFVFPSKRPKFFCCRREREELGPVPPLLTWKVVQQKMAWNVILLLGGGFAMAYGSNKSGLSQLIGEQLEPLRYLDPFLANLVCCLAICAMTQCTSNTATATVFLPILAELAQVLNVNPLFLMLPSTLITSYAFMLPVSTPPNAIAYSYKHLKMKDMLIAGTLLNFIGILIALFSIYTFGGVSFNAYDNCPDWLVSVHCNATATSLTINNVTVISNSSVIT